ncbi:hypothetical protein COEREDRAFT_87546 [Coemansia reversa NRRL 1564]|uniref:Mid2 domain-containing protein n=1 Tax=Coemansia reversa (strain ATCC 12441 / NRRL 1564) TaxID=763665 RepID=A0A2G5B9V1_COERN|nr:hypothetical protein COEREDRAFT_87546 [Coemansia reversa NRRL 1564]|eukprot:PIA15796.1 hypothetical protein COEREDRAFT_87546 [Coemansia reversa NRRL 1564]
MRWKHSIAVCAAILLAHPWQVHGWNADPLNSISNTTIIDELARRDVAGCPAGYTNCENFGCIEGSDCPKTCSKRDLKTCSFSVNGVGCKWETNVCVQDVQCPINNKGSCPKGCSGCGQFQCINAELKCPVPCKERERDDCRTSALYNGIGCVWNENECIAWDVINAMPLDKNQIKANEDLSPFANSNISDSDSESSSTSTEEPSETSSEDPSSESSETSSETSSEEPTDETTQDSSETDSKTNTSESDTNDAETEETDTEEPDTDEDPDTSDDESSGEGAAAAEKNSGSSKVPMYIGIAAGVLVLIGLISWGALYYFSKKKKKNNQDGVYLDESNPLPTYNPDGYDDYDNHNDYDNHKGYNATSYTDYSRKNSGDAYSYAKHYSSAYGDQQQQQRPNIGGWDR